MMLSSPDQLAATPKRIVSLVPSQTELLHYLGLEEETVGVTKFCIHPKEWFRSKTNIGGTKNINIKRILQLQPDLVIANKEENIKEQIEELAKYVPVWVTDVNNIKDAHKMILDIGALTRKKVAAKKLAAKIETAFRQVSPPVNKINTCYLIWKNPYMSIGKDTFIHDVLKQSGFKNIFSSEKRYPKVTVALIQELKPKLIMLSSEPYPFKEKHIAELQQQLPDSKVILVDGELFSWYGSRMILLPDYLKQLKQLLTN